MKKVVKLSLFSLLILIITLLIIFSFATTQPGLKSIVIPIIEKLVDANIAADTIYLSILKGELKTTNFSYTATDNSYSIKVKNLSLEMSLKGLFKNKYTVNHLNAENSEITIDQTIEEKSEEASINTEKKSETEEKSVDTELPLFLDLSNINIKNLNFIYTMKRKNNSETSILKLLNSNLNIPTLKTGSNGQIKYNCDIEISSPSKTVEGIRGSLEGTSVLRLNSESYPINIKSESVLKFLNKSTPINIILEQKAPGENAPAPFTLSSKIKNMPLMPIVKAFLKGSYSSANGCLDNLEINMEGTDIENVDIYRNIKGNLILEISDLEIPTQLLNFAIVKLIFLPIYIIAHLNNYLEQNEVLPSQITNILGISNDILTGTKEFSFRSGNTNLAIENGLINIRKLLLIGGRGCAIREMNFNGYVDLNSNIDVRTVTNITGIVIPLRIKGTLNDPKPDVKKIIPGLLGKTAENLVKTTAEVGLNFGKKITESAGNFISEIPDIINDNGND